MTFPPDGAARSLCVAADEALAARAGDWAGEAFATGGLAMVLHHRNLGKLIDGSAPADPGAPPSG